LWVPVDGSLVDRIGGVVGVPTTGTQVIAGGIEGPQNNGSKYVTFPTNCGIGANGAFSAMVCFSVKNPDLVGGYFLRLGSETNGMAMGGGNGTSTAVPGRVFWRLLGGAHNGSSDYAFKRGALNCAIMSVTSDPFNVAYSPTDGAIFDFSSFSAPSATLLINGGPSSRGSGVRVYAAAIFKGYDLTAVMWRRARIIEAMREFVGDVGDDALTERLRSFSNSLYVGDDLSRPKSTMRPTVWR
jgi:hypothetical protein